MEIGCSVSPKVVNLRGGGISDTSHFCFIFCSKWSVAFAAATSFVCVCVHM